MDSLYSVPSQWLPVGTGSFKFDVALSLPTSRATPLAISMSNGILRNNSSKVHVCTYLCSCVNSACVILKVCYIIVVMLSSAACHDIAAWAKLPV